METYHFSKGINYSQRPIDEVFLNSVEIGNRGEMVLYTYRFSTKICNDDEEASQHSCYEVQIGFEPSFFEILSSQERFEMPSSQRYPICCNTQLILLDLVHSSLEGNYRSLLIESKCIELFLQVHIEFRHKEKKCEQCKFLTLPYQREKIVEAKRILLEHIFKPPSITALAKLVGINECYLKKGFRELFDTTIYNFIQEQRMSKAKQFVLHTKQSMSEIADTLGFASASSFSNAFKKQMGILPKGLRSSVDELARVQEELV